MSQLSYIYSEFKKDNFCPRNEAVAFTPKDDLTILLHPEVPECLWFVQWQKRNGISPVISYWSVDFGRWVFV